MESRGVSQLGPDVYAISANAWPVRGGSVGAAHEVAISDATEFCAKTEKEMVVTRIESTESTAKITFRCVERRLDSNNLEVSLIPLA